MIKKRSTFARISAAAVAASVLALTAGVGAANATETDPEFDAMFAANSGTINFQFNSATLGDGYDVAVTSPALDLNTSDDLEVFTEASTDATGLATAQHYAGPVKVFIKAKDGGETVAPEPEETETPAPEETETPVPEETETPAPEETETPAPEETETPAPEETETPAPEETETPAPEETETLAPVTFAAAAEAVIFSADAAIWRGQTVTYNVSFDGSGNVVLDATSTPVPTIPTLDELDNMFTVADYDLQNAAYGTDSRITSPGIYLAGEDLNLAFSNIADYSGAASFDGVALSDYLYTSPKSLGGSTVAAGAYAAKVGATYTSEPHTFASFDNFGRLVLFATLDGGAVKQDSPVTPPVTGQTNNPGGLAETGAAENLALGLSAAAVLALGGALVARNLRLGRQS
ncbi:hypothetical protein [Lysinibacter cavernae]|uniref:hypothetical protein n=1 Tax=Lysinibacter cavernae TaxID=1640652 RepID=UPI00361BF2DF